VFLTAGSERKVEELLNLVVEVGASGVHLTVGAPPTLRVDGKLWRLPDLASSGPERAKEKAAAFLAEKLKWRNPVTPVLAESLTAELLTRDQHRNTFENRGTVRFALSVPGLSRFRVSVFRQRGCPAISVRALGRGVPDLDALFEPLPEAREALLKLAEAREGLIVVAGPAGSGKTATLTALTDRINRTRALHVVTVEDPIEYLHSHALSVVDQREVGEDTESVAAGVASAVAAGADVVVAGDVQDGAAADAVLAAAEAGKLVLCAVRSSSLEDAVFALADMIGGTSALQRLASALRAVVFQKTVPSNREEGRVVAAGVYSVVRPAKLAIRNGDRIQAVSVLRNDGGRCPLERSLARLVASGLVALEDAEECAEDMELFWRYMRLF